MLLEPFLLGISTGSYCVISCAPITLPILFSSDADRWRNFSTVSQFLIGRFVGYTIFGSVLGYTGNIISVNSSFSIQWKLGGSANIIIGLIMIFYGIIYHFPKSRMCKHIIKNKKESAGAFYLGLLTGLNVCPPFIAATIRVLTSGSILYGFTFFILFYLGTSIYFIPLYGVHLFKKHLKKIREVARITMILLGLYYLVLHGILVLYANSNI